MRILIIFLMVFEMSYAQYGTLTGNIYDKIKKSSYEMAVVSIKEINKTVFTNAKGDFIIDSISVGEHVLKVACLGCSDTTFKINITNNQTLDLKLKVPFNCTNYNKDNKICPICKKSDLVIPIVYGLIVVTGKKGKKKKEPEFYSGGCVITGCDPNWYCKRDNKVF